MSGGRGGRGRGRCRRRGGLGPGAEWSEEETCGERAGDNGKRTALAHAESYQLQPRSRAGPRAGRVRERYFVGQGVSVRVSSRTRPLRPRRCSVYFVPRGTRLKVPATSCTSAIGSASTPSPPTT